MTDQQRQTILVLAYSISPARGSEYAVGWNYVTHMSRDNDLVVLYGLAGDHMGDIEEMAGAGEQFGGRVTFVPVLPGRRARIANHLNRTGRMPFSFYVAYRYWHMGALAAARRIVAERRIDLIHYLCPIGYREPGYLWKLDKPYIWGPIGGMNLRPLRAFFDLSPRAGLRTAGRNFANWLQFRISARLRRAIRHTDLLITNTTENRNLIARVHGRIAEVLPENAIVARGSPRTTAPGTSIGPLNLIWVGRIDQAKALKILIDALAMLVDAEWRLVVVGEGPRAAALRALAGQYGIADRIVWTGRVSRKRVAQHFAETDVHILTSLAEAHSTVLWEAMGAGVPTIAIDHCGMHDSICDACGIKVPLADVKTMSKRLAVAIRRLIDDRAMVQRLSDGALGCAERNSWKRRTVFWQDAYARAIAAYAARGARR